MNETEVSFNWNGEEYTATGIAEIEIGREDIGPCRQGEHCMADVVDSVTMVDVEILKDGELVVDPSKELIEKADCLLSCKAEDDFYEE